VDAVEIGGPLKGLLSVHQKFPEHDILLMACDMIDMEQGTIENLIKKYEQQPAYDFYVHYGHFSEPFCAIYTSHGLKPVMEKAQTHALADVSFQSIINAGNTLRIQIADKSSFDNYNIMPGHHQHP
jgi:molybdopterin-guanine dinucleotide biosynthesis protein A